MKSVSYPWIHIWDRGYWVVRLWWLWMSAGASEYYCNCSWKPKRMKCGGEQYTDEQVRKNRFNVGKQKWECWSLREVPRVSGLQERTAVLSIDVELVVNCQDTIRVFSSPFVFSDDRHNIKKMWLGGKRKVISSPKAYESASFGKSWYRISGSQLQDSSLQSRWQRWCKGWKISYHSGVFQRRRCWYLRSSNRWDIGKRLEGPACL